MSTQVYQGGILREHWDDVTRTYTAWDEAGTQTDQRPYTADENTTADTEAVEATQTANKSSTETNLEADKVAMQAIKDQANADLRDDPSQEIKDIAVAVRRLINMALNDFSEAE